MRAAFGLVGLVVALALVGVLVKKQLAATRAPVPALQGVPGVAPAASDTTVRQQSQQMQQQVKQQMEGLMQQARPMPEDGKNQ